MFRAPSAHHQEVNDANCTYAASGIPEAVYVQFFVIDLLMMGGWRSKHVEEFNFM